MWQVAWLYPDLRRLIPALADAKSNCPPPSDLPYREMLETFAASEGTEAGRASHVHSQRPLCYWNALLVANTSSMMRPRLRLRRLE
jgi:hypothetical protein